MSARGANNLRRKIKRFVRKHRRLLISLLFTLAVVAIGFAVYGIGQLEEWLIEVSERQSVMFEEEVRPLQVEKNTLNAEFSNLEPEMVKSLGNNATLGVAVLDLDEEFFETVASIFAKDSKGKARNLVGTLCLSESNIPGGDGKITVERFEALLDAGWTVTLFYDTPGSVIFDSTLRTWLDEMRKVSGALGIEMPKSIIIDSGYTTEIDPTLKEFGINTVVHRGDDGFPFIEKTAGEGGMWRPAAIGWNDSGVASNMLIGLLQQGGHFTFTVGAGRRTDELFVHTKEEYRRSLGNMLTVIQQFCDSGDLELMGLDAAREFRIDYTERYAAGMVAVETRKAEIEAEIDRIDAEIVEILKKYHK